MSRVHWLASGLAAVLGISALGVWYGYPSKPDGKPIPGLSERADVTLYSLDGAEDSERKYREALEHGNEVLQTYAVLGKVDVADAQDRARLITALQRAAMYHDGPPAECFWPRHAIVTTESGRRQEIVICFQCRQYTIDGRGFPTISRSPEKLFNEHLQRAGIPIAP